MYGDNPYQAAVYSLSTTAVQVRVTDDILERISIKKTDWKGVNFSVLEI